MSHTEHFCQGDCQLKVKIVPAKQHTSFHRCFGILSASVIGSINVSFMTRVSGIQMAHKRWTQSPSTVCLNAPPSFGHKMHDCEMKGVRVPSEDKETAALPQVFRVRRCIFGTAIGLQEYTVLHNNLDVQQDYTHHKTQSRSCSRPPNRRKWRTSNPRTALPYPVWASSLSVCKVQVRTLGNVYNESAPGQTNLSPNGP